MPQTVAAKISELVLQDEQHRDPAIDVGKQIARVVADYLPPNTRLVLLHSWGKDRLIFEHNVAGAIGHKYAIVRAEPSFSGPRCTVSGTDTPEIAGELRETFERMLNQAFYDWGTQERFESLHVVKM